MDRASSKLGPRYKEGLDVFQAQVVIKATLFLTAMYLILEAINYYYYFIVVSFHIIYNLIALIARNWNCVVSD